MANKLDDRYVEYDLANSINVLPVEHGGTGVGAYPNANRILITKATGIPASPISIEDSGWGIGSMGALSSWDANKGPFEARIQTGETHIANVSLHLPSGGSNVTFLRGDNTWQTISTTANLVFAVDNFTNSNNTNVQDILEDFDDAIYNLSIAAPNAHTHASSEITDLTTTINNIAGDSALGVNQTWQDVSAGRVINTNYRNTTGKPIEITIRCSASTTAYLDVSVNGTTWVNIGYANVWTFQSFIIPDDNYYRFRTTAAQPSIWYWLELR